MRCNGVASVDYNNPLKSVFPEAQFVVRVREIFNNCPRYVHTMMIVERSRFVPKSGCVTPVPGWKAGDWVAEVLSENDQARDKSREVLWRLNAWAEPLFTMDGGDGAVRAAILVHQYPVRRAFEVVELAGARGPQKCCDPQHVVDEEVAGFHLRPVCSCAAV